MSYAFVFPGQGSQTLGMLKELAEAYPLVLKTFTQASQVLKEDLWAITQHNEAKLNQTLYTQPIMLTADVAVFRLWQELNGSMPKVMAGHSLGEYAALVCADALAFEDAVSLVSKRAQYMQEACKPGEGGMAAIVGLEENTIEQLCKEASVFGMISPANYNSIGQIVVAGQTKAVETVVQLAKEKGAKIAKIIPVSVPAHCHLMTSAAERLANELTSVEIKKPKIPVIHNVDAASHENPQEIKTLLVQQMTSCVQWVKTVQAFENYSIRAIVECGPGKVLTGLSKRIDKELIVYVAATPDMLKTAWEELK
ncbi:MAG: [acyl-carrier-protein] S-malonyltransferase [Gammaproteobacteria bacterium RIFOXYB2_FULL_38_6]|nr:MAG: [acyl-carrier-protein] S-malonyltransferase [Gammaproteobacteria bacterium RIFOXYB2_FULL_38_6]